MEEEIYKVNKPIKNKIEDNITYQRYNKTLVKDMPIDDMRILLKLFFNKAAINMGKDSYDAPDATIDSILEFTYREFNILPVMYIASAIVRGSLGKYGIGRLVPKTIYGWMHEILMEYERIQKHEKIKSINYSDSMDLVKYPIGQAIIKKIEWYQKGILSDADWEKVSLKEMAKSIGQKPECVPEIFGLKSIKTKV